MTRIRASHAGSGPWGPGRRDNVVMQDSVIPDHSSRRSHPLVLLLPVLGLAGLGLSIAWDVRAPSSGPGHAFAAEAGWTYALTGVILAALGVVVLWWQPTQRFGWALAVLGLLWVLDGMAQSYVRTGLTADSAWPAMTAVLWFLTRITGLLPVGAAVLLLIFPTGRMLSGRWGVAGRVSVALMLLAIAVLTISYLPASEVPDDLPPGVDPNPASLPDIALIGSAGRALFLVGIALFVVPLATPVVRYLRSSGLERDRLRWLLWAVIVIVLALGIAVVLDSALASNLAFFLVTVLPGVAMTIAIVSPRIVPIEDLLGTTALYGTLTAGIVAVDLAALSLVTTVLDDSLEQRQVVLVVLLLSAVVYGPLRQRLQQWVRRAMLGERGNPYGVVSGLASSLETADEGPGQLATIASAVAAAFGVPFVSVEVDRSRGERLVATHGARPAETRVLPITYRDTEVGRLVLPLHGARAKLSARDERLLGDLVRQAAAAARATRLAGELQDSREHLVVAREEERRRIRRDLHDGLGPALSGVVFRLESARLLVADDPEAAQQHLAVTLDHVKDVVADIRRLVHDLRPPALDDRGLVGAVTQQAETVRAAGVDVTVHAEDVGALSAAVEVAAYRIIGEALTNIARHAEATTGRVVLRLADDDLSIEVADNGNGIPPDAEVGVGLLSLRERVAELGGRSEIICPPGGGTTVRARLPLRSPS
nr:sensor histidine kinase [Aeromicrobium sp.]